VFDIVCCGLPDKGRSREQKEALGQEGKVVTRNEQAGEGMNVTRCLSEEGKMAGTRRSVAAGNVGKSRVDVCFRLILWRVAEETVQGRDAETTGINIRVIRQQ